MNFDFGPSKVTVSYAPFKASVPVTQAPKPKYKYDPYFTNPPYGRGVCVINNDTLEPVECIPNTWGVVKPVDTETTQLSS